MRIGFFVFLVGALITRHVVVGRPAGVEFWNTCSLDDLCSTTTGEKPTSLPPSITDDETSSPTPTASAPTKDQPGSIPPNNFPPQSISENSNYTYGDNTITVQLGITGGILIALGVYLMILGFRSFRPTLAVTGFLEFGLVAWIGLINAKPAYGYANDAITMITVPAGVAVLGAILYAYFWSVSYYLIGAMGGFTFGMFVLLWREDLVIVNDIGRYCFLGGLALVCAGLTKFMERHVILKSTSFTGAFILIVGIDCLAHVGYLSGIIKLLDRNVHHTRATYEIDGRIYGLMVGIILLFLVSFGWQSFFNLGRRFGVNGGILARVFQRHHQKQEEHVGDGGSNSGASDPSPRSSGEHHAKSEHHVGDNLVEQVVHHIEEALENHGNHSNGSHHHS